MRQDTSYYIAILYRNGKTIKMPVIASSLEEAGRIVEQQKNGYRLLQIIESK